MDQPPLPLAIAAPTRRRGRPPGAKNKRSIDLARYVEATFGGMTPGQVSAELALVKPKDLARAKAMARELGIVDLELPPLMLAMVVKAKQLSRALGCTSTEAWILLQKERAELLGYIHQKLPPKAEPKGGVMPTVFLIPEGEAGDQAQLPDFSAEEDDADIEFVGELGAPAQQVGQPKSDDNT